MAGPDPRKEYQRGVARMESRTRGLMLGLALGDTLGAVRGRAPAAGPLRAGVATQLACFTAEGVIRAMVRGQHKGVCHPPGVVLHAYCRWAALQGIEEERMRRRWASYPPGRPWPDGWLAGVPALTERRGSAPATVAALSRIEDPHSRIATGSRGCHALVRTLPVAVAGPHWTEQAGEFAALTHGDPAARSAAERAAVLLRHCLTAPRPDGPGDRGGAHRARGPGEGARRPALRRGAGGGRDGAPVRRRPARPARPAGPARPGRDGPLRAAGWPLHGRLLPRPGPVPGRSGVRGGRAGRRVRGLCDRGAARRGARRRGAARGPGEPPRTGLGAGYAGP
ncbi:hypothetical protein GCM10010360_04500 [Streptomyces nogalater]